MSLFRRQGETEERYQARVAEHHAAHRLDGRGADVRTLVNAARRALPLLERLGDLDGNGPVDVTRPGSLGVRCDVMGDLKAALRALAFHSSDKDGAL